MSLRGGTMNSHWKPDWKKSENFKSAFVYLFVCIFTFTDIFLNILAAYAMIV